MSRRALPAPPVGALDLEVPVTPEPIPRGRSRAAVGLLLLARVVLWALVAVGALRGLLPPGSDGRGAAAPAAIDRQLAGGVAAAFLREYLTVDGDRAGRARRLRRFTASGVDLDRAVALPAATSQYADQLEAVGVRPAPGGAEVTVLAHLLEVRGGSYQDRGTVAMVVPVAGGPGGLAVRGPPWPAPLPVDRSLRAPLPGSVAGPGWTTSGATAARRAARRAVAALLAGDGAALARLGGGTPPATSPLPTGWRAGRVTRVGLGGPAGAPVAQVLVLAAAPQGSARYLVPVRVWFSAGPRGPLVRRVDAGDRGGPVTSAGPVGAVGAVGAVGQAAPATSAGGR